jgi:DNA polymerase V
MQVLSHFSPEMEIYSIDEAFLLEEKENPLDFAQAIKKRVLQWTGIPVSIGIGKTKTLAKVASDLAKNQGIFALYDQEVLKELSPLDIWGIGSRLNIQLKEAGIHTAWDLKEANDIWLRKTFSVNILRTVMELRGEPCFSLHESPPQRKSLVCSRSFGVKVSSLTDLNEALACYTAQAAQTLREEKLLASVLSIFLQTSPFDPKPYTNSAALTLSEPTAYTPHLLRLGKKALTNIYREGYLYQKVGILLTGILEEQSYQPDLFADSAARTKGQRAMEALDSLKGAFGKSSIRLGAEGIAQPWRRRSHSRSPSFTTKWEELLTIRLVPNQKSF